MEHSSGKDYVKRRRLFMVRIANSLANDTASGFTGRCIADATMNCAPTNADRYRLVTYMIAL